MKAICQIRLPVAPWMSERMRRLPGLNPVEPGEWLSVDDAYDAQMAYREMLLATRRKDVLRMSPGARAAADELLERVLREVASMGGFVVESDEVRRPDGAHVAIDRDNPLATCAKIVQEDLVIMQQNGDEHVLTGAVLCFPASWSLDQKFMRPLIAIHGNVDEYDDDIAKRVQRLFDFIKADQPMWRANYLTYTNPDLYQPRREGQGREFSEDAPVYMRSERQTLLRLPRTGAVVFSIHTYVVPMDALTPEQAQSYAGLVAATARS